MSNIIRFLPILILFSVTLQFVSSKVILSKENSGDLLYEYETSECSCKNNGVCVLDSDFCVCKPEYTGRYCELEMRDTKNSCGGQFLNNEYQYLDCSKCWCSRNVLSCEAIKSDTCNFNQFKSKLNITRKSNLNDIRNLKKLKLTQLVKLMDIIEGYSYKYFINKFQNEENYEIVYSDLSVSNKHVRQHEIKSLSHHHHHNHRNKIIVFVSDEKIVGLYFPFGAGMEPKSHSSSLRVNLSSFFTLNIFGAVLCFFCNKIIY
jgi:hypothetical protein